MIIEHRTFRLAAGSDEAAFLAADRRVQTEVVPFQHGFIRRTTARNDDGRWLVERPRIGARWHPGHMDLHLRHVNLRVRDAAACRDFYVAHLGFEPAFDAEGGHFLRDGSGFLLAVVPTAVHTPLPDGFHIGFTVPVPEEVAELHGRLTQAGVRTGPIEDLREDEDYVTFRCWDPDGTEIEVYWDGT